MPAAADTTPIPQAKEGRGVTPYKQIDAPAVWYADELSKHPEEWKQAFTPEQILELEAATVVTIKTGKPIEEITLADVSLPTLAPVLTAVRDEVVRGRGFHVLTGLPVDRWTQREIVTAYWILGLHWGNALSNNHQGHLVGHVKDIGQDPNDPTTRLYATNLAQPYHTDGADIVTLLCIRNARVGGESQWASSYALHNELLKLRPDLSKTLTGPWYFDRNGEIPEGQKAYFSVPAFNYYKGNLTVNWSSLYFRLSQRHPEVPRLTQEQIEAIELFDKLAASPRFSLHHKLAPGDLQLLSNHTVVHARSAFIDDAEDPSTRRHLLRLWLAPTNEFPLPEPYAAVLGSVEIGHRGGIIVPGAKLHVTLDAE